MTSQDETFMGLAVAMARRALGQAWPNPAVGAVLVNEGSEPEIIARGWTMPGGRPHAETEALDRAGERAEGATLYVTLEPCAHQGRTPPCVDAIIAANVKRVVCGLQDPDPRVSGRGMEKLRDAGIDIKAGVLKESVFQLTAGHLLRTTVQRPQIILKLAVGSDGRIAEGDGTPVWVTGEQARTHGHLMRARTDAILVGRGTIAADDPALTCRLPGLEHRSPVRVVLDSRLRTSHDAGILLTSNEIPVWICCGDDVPVGQQATMSATGADVIAVKRGGGGLLDPVGVAAVLAERGITRLLIEGGPGVARSFLEAGIIDDVVIFQGQSPAGDNGLHPFVTGGIEQLEHSGEFQIADSHPIGQDVVMYYRKISTIQ